MFTRCQTRENGIAPSLEKAYPILELVVMHPEPQRKVVTATTPKHRSAPAPPPYLLRKAVCRACATAYPPASLPGSRRDGMSSVMSDVRATRTRSTERRR